MASSTVTSTTGKIDAFKLDFSDNWQHNLQQKVGYAATAAGVLPEKYKRRAVITNSKGEKIDIFAQGANSLDESQFPLRVAFPKPEAKTGPLKTRVFFRYCCSTEAEDEIRVVGGPQDLGNWAPTTGYSLSRSQEESNCWITPQGVLLPLGRKFEYRYAICKKETGELVRWEQKEEKRSVVPTGLRHILEDDNGEFRIEAAGSTDLGHSPGSHIAPPPNGMRIVDPTLQTRTTIATAGYPGAAPGQALGFLPEDGPAAISPRLSPNASPTLKASRNSIVVPPPQKGRLSDGQMEFKIEEAAPDTPSGEDVVYLVFRTLPIQVHKDEESGEWVMEKMSYNSGTVLPMLRHWTKPHVANGYGFNVRFVGSPGVWVPPGEDRKKITEMLASRSCIPVWVDQPSAEQHHSFCLEFLWPVFHNVKVFDSGAEENVVEFDKVKWKHFIDINNSYASALEKLGSEQAIIWIQDYELVLVPRYLYLRCPTWTIGLFLHCGFPSSEVLRCLPVREDILQSMLSSRLVTFQVFDYMRNFMSCCTVLLGARVTFSTGGILQVEHKNKNVFVTADHFALPYEYLVNRLPHESIQSRAADIRKEFAGKTIIASHDRCERFAGLALKLEIFHRFLSEYEGFRDKVVLVQYVSSFASHGNDMMQELLVELEKIAAKTNAAFGQKGQPPPVTIRVEEMDRDRRLAVLAATDVLLDTSITDGLNLTPFIFYAAHSKDKGGIAIVSEFCGCSNVLTGVYKVNPWNTMGVMTALDQALSLQPAQRAERFARDFAYVATQTTVKWVTHNVTELRGTRSIASGGDGFHFGSQRGRQLDYNEVIDAYRKAKTRVFFLDNEGTLAANSAFKITAGGLAVKGEGKPPDPEVLESLQSLASDRNSSVVVISGRNKEFLDVSFQSVDSLGLAAEHGFWQVAPRSLQQKSADPKQRWKCQTEMAEDSEEWKDVVCELFRQYVRRVQGSRLEAKASAITWKYLDVGALAVVDDLALELARFLDPNDEKGLLHGYPVKVVRGKGYLEVKRRDVDKGTTVTQVLQDLSRHLGAPVDFILCVGDDRSDEDMFEAVEKFCSQLQDVPAPSFAAKPLGGLEAAKNKTGSLASFRSVDSDGAVSSIAQLSPTPSALGLAGSVAEDSSDIVRNDSALTISNPGTPAIGPASSPAISATAGKKPRHFTVTVGRKPSKAAYFVADVGEVSELLKKLAQKAIVSSFSRFASMPTFEGGMALGGGGLAGMVEDDDDEDDFPSGPQPANTDRRFSEQGLGNATTHHRLASKS